MKKSDRIRARKKLSVFLVIYSILFLVISIIPAQAFGNEDENNSMYGIITGIVTDSETNDPIPDTLMTLRYHDIVRFELTDSTGKYTFTEVPMCFCLKNVSAFKSGYESQYKMVAVHKVTYVNFSLKPDGDGNGSMYGIITGVVTDAETNDPIQDALMTLKYHDIVRTELTDSKGQYTFTEVPMCFCLKNVSAFKSGYESQYQLVAVSEVTYANFSLNPIPDDNPEQNPNLISDKTIDGGVPIELKNHYIVIFGLVGAIMVVILGNIYIRKKSNGKSEL